MAAFQLEPIAPADAPTRLFAQAAEVSSVALGAHILSTSDEWFAPASDLLKVAPAPSLKGTFGPKGALFDGWETRRHNPLPQAYDWVILRLGPSGGAHLLGLDIDTANFNGNEAPEVQVHALSVAPHEEAQGGPATLAEDDPRWVSILPTTPCGPSQQHFFASTTSQPTRDAYTHIKLVMIPDGGIARFRVYGVIPPAPLSLGIGELTTSSSSSSSSSTTALNTLDLAHVLNGGRVIFTSDQHFGSGANIILPGRGKDMGDGWETRRSRHPGHKDWTIIQLAQRAYLTSAEIDTIHFLGNFPNTVELHALDLSNSTTPPDLAALGSPDESAAGWRSILPKSKVGPGKQHFFDLQQEDRAGSQSAVTHVRVTMHPDGGIKRVRLYGRRADLLENAPKPWPTVALPTPESSSSRAPAGVYPIPPTYPVTGQSPYDSELRAALRAAAAADPEEHRADEQPPPLQSLSLLNAPPPHGLHSGGGPAGAAAAVSTASSTAIRIEPLTRETYAPYGSVLAGPASPSSDLAAKTVNQGTAAKFLSLGSLVSTYPAEAQPAPSLLHIFRCAPRFSLVAHHPSQQQQQRTFAIKVLERHRYTTQAFVPLTADRATQEGYLVIVALPHAPPPSSSSSSGSPPADHGANPAGPDLRTLRAFLATSTQGITYHPGVWHHPMVALGTAETDFVCAVHESVPRPELDCDEVFYGEAAGGEDAPVVLL